MKKYEYEYIPFFTAKYDKNAKDDDEDRLLELVGDMCHLGGEGFRYVGSARVVGAGELNITLLLMEREVE